MPRIIIAGASEASRAQLARILAASGWGAFRLCASGSELRRVLSACEDGVVVVAGSVSDCSVDDVAADFSGDFQFLLIARPEALAACESPGVFKLTYPCPGSAVTGAVEMLAQLHTMRMPRREGEEKALVEEAKALLMHRDGLTEAEAHRRIQLSAMQGHVKMTEVAQELLKEN